MLKKIQPFYVKFIEWIIIFIYFVLFYFDFIEINRIKIFFFVLLIMWSYILVINFLKKEHEMLAVRFHKIFKRFKLEKKIILNLIKIFVYIYVYFNPLIYIMKVELKLYFFLRKINYYLINYEKLRIFIYLFFFCLFIHPIKILFLLFYNILEKLQKKTLIELIFKRISGLILSILIFTNIINYIFFYYKNLLLYLNINIDNIYIYIFVLLYILLIFLSLFQNLWFLPKNYDNSMEFYFKKNNLNLIERLKLWLYEDTNTLNLIKLRIQYTIFGIIINNLLFFLEYNNIYLNEIKDEILLSFWYGRQFKEHKNRNEIMFKKVFFAYINSIHYMKNEIKYKPSILFYQLLNCDAPIGLYDWEDLFTILLKENNEEIQQRIKKYFEKMEEYLKYGLFKIWDMEKYYGFDKKLFPNLDKNKELKEEQFLCNFKIDFGTYKNKNKIFFDIYNNNNIVKQLSKNKEKFIDFEDNYDLYFNIYKKFNSNEFEKLKNEIDDYIDSLDVKLFKHYANYDENLESNKDRFPKKLASKENQNEILEIMKEMMLFKEKLEKEWFKEWEEKKRNYIWKD